MLAGVSCIQRLQTTFWTLMLRHSVIVWYATRISGLSSINSSVSEVLLVSIRWLSDVYKKTVEQVQIMNCKTFATYYIVMYPTAQFHAFVTSHIPPTMFLMLPGAMSVHHEAALSRDATGLTTPSFAARTSHISSGLLRSLCTESSGASPGPQHNACIVQLFACNIAARKVSAE
jgi:hypothetical protein